MRYGPRKKWIEVVKNDLRKFIANRKDAQNRDLCRSFIHGRQANLSDLEGSSGRVIMMTTTTMIMMITTRMMI